MSSFDTNFELSHWQKRAWSPAFVAFLLWWVAKLLQRIFFRSRGAGGGVAAPVAGAPVAGAPAATAAATGWTPHDHESFSDAMRDVFISLFAVTTFLFLVNGLLPHGIEHLLWCALAFGIVWALAEGILRWRILSWLLALAILLPIAFFVALWSLGFRDAELAGTPDVPYASP